MPVRSVIDIDVNDAKFKDFLGSFDKYNKALKDTAPHWDDAARSAGAVALASMATTEEMEKQRKEEEAQSARRKKEGAEEQRRIKAAATEMEKLRRTVKDIGESMLSGTASLLRWVGIGGMLSGLLGGGALFGLDRLASSMGNARRSAGGLGVTSGQQQSANINFGRYVDTNQVLGGIASAQTNADLWAFRAVGIDPSGKNPAELMAELNLKAQKIYKPLAGKPMSEYNAKVQALQALGYSMSDLRRLSKSSTGELRAATGQYYKDAGDLGVSDKAQLGWQTFMAQMDRAGQKIENIFGEKMGQKLAPALEKLSAAVVHIVEKFTGSGVFDKMIDSLVGGLEKFGDYVSSPKFLKDIDTFITDFGLVAEALVRGLKFLGIIPKSEAEKQVEAQKWENQNDAQGHPNWWAGAMTASPMSYQAPAAGLNPLFQRTSMDYPTSSGGSNYMSAIYQMESASGRNAGYSSAGALGPFQLMPGTAKRFGVTDRRDFAQSKRAAQQYMSILLKMFHGDLGKALAGYNWGEGNVLKDIAKHGTDWLRFAPKETQDYVRRGLSLSINNNTGGNANVQLNQAGQGI